LLLGFLLTTNVEVKRKEAKKKKGTLQQNLRRNFQPCTLCFPPISSSKALLCSFNDEIGILGRAAVVSRMPSLSHVGTALSRLQ